MTQNHAEKKIAFYALLVGVIRNERFVESSAGAVVYLHKEIESEVSISGITIDLLRELHKAYHRDKDDFDSLLWLVGTAFSDLAKHLRWPAARKTFEDLRQLVDVEHRDLFLRVVNVRPLADGPDGCAVVTMVVDNHRKFRAFLENKDAAENVRWSDDETIAT